MSWIIKKLSITNPGELILLKQIFILPVHVKICFCRTNFEPFLYRDEVIRLKTFYKFYRPFCITSSMQLKTILHETYELPFFHLKVTNKPITFFLTNFYKKKTCRYYFKQHIDEHCLLKYCISL